MSKVNHGQVFENGNVMVRGKIDPNNKNYYRLKTMAERAHCQGPMLHELENPKTGGMKELKAHLGRCVEFTIDQGPWEKYTASQFVVCLLHRAGKPVSENLILKRLRENDVFLPYPRIAVLVTNLHIEGIVRQVDGKGLLLTDAMKSLIDEVKPTE